MAKPSRAEFEENSQAIGDIGSAQDWSKMRNDFNNAGYREGNSAGKEITLQKGFDEGFVSVGSPTGRVLGFSRGIVSALYNFTADGEFSGIEKSQTMENLKKIEDGLACIGLADIRKIKADPSRPKQELSSSDFVRNRLMDAYDLYSCNSSPLHLRQQIQQVLTEADVNISLLAEIDKERR